MTRPNGGRREVQLGPLRLPLGSQPLVLLLCLSALLLFGMLTDEMLEGGADRIDRAILIGLRRTGDLAVPLGPKWLPQAAADITALGGFTVLWMLSAAAVGYLALVGRRTDALLIAISSGGASLLNMGLKTVVGRGRPEVVPHLVEVSNASYPSGHAMVSAAAYLTIAAMLARGQASRAARLYLLGCGVTLALLIGLSRLYLGVHWPTDVLAGWCLGSAWALALWMLSQRFRGDRAGPGAP